MTSNPARSSQVARSFGSQLPLRCLIRLVQDVTELDGRARKGILDCPLEEPFGDRGAGRIPVVRPGSVDQNERYRDVQLRKRPEREPPDDTVAVDSQVAPLGAHGAGREHPIDVCGLVRGPFGIRLKGEERRQLAGGDGTNREHGSPRGSGQTVESGTSPSPPSTSRAGAAASTPHGSRISTAQFATLGSPTRRCASPTEDLLEHRQGVAGEQHERHTFDAAGLHRQHIADRVNRDLRGEVDRIAVDARRDRGERD